jgi:hypothetical protein
VDLEEVDIVCLQSLEAGMDLVDDGLARKTRLIHVVTLVLQVWMMDCS